jgi:DNA-binding CsgD family transcriptional regulator
MPSERIQRRIDVLLDEADTAFGCRDWQRLRELASDVLSLDVENADGLTFLDAAERNLGTSPGAVSGTFVPSPSLPASFASGRYTVSGFLGEGGSKKGYLAQDTRLDRDVAVAIIEGLAGDGLESGRRLRPCMSATAFLQPPGTTWLERGERVIEPRTREWVAVEARRISALRHQARSFSEQAIRLWETAKAMTVAATRGPSAARDASPSQGWRYNAGRMSAAIRYVSLAPGRRLAYTVDGRGEAVLLIPSMPFSFLKEESKGMTSALQRELAAAFRLIRYDACGTGYSGLTRDSFTLASFVEEASALADHLHLRRFAVVGIVDAAPVAIALAASDARVTTLVLHDGWARYNDYREAAWESAEAALRDGDWTVYTETVSQMQFRFEDQELARNQARTMRRSASRDMLRDAYSGMAEWDVSSLLPGVRCPTLVSQGATPFLHTNVAERLATAIPGAHLATLRKSIEIPAGVFLAFLKERSSKESSPAEQPLSPRELEVLRLVARGCSNGEIASKLAISTNTVMRHVSNIFAKTDTRNRVEAAVYAVNRGLLESPDASSITH